MRILQVVHGFPPRERGGTETYVYQLSRELARRHDVHVVYPVHEGPRLSVRGFTRGTLRFHELTVPSSLFDTVRRGLCFETSYRNEQVDEIFDRVLAEIEPDIVHVQHLVRLSASFVSVAKSRGVPTVLTTHDCWLICPRANLMAYDCTVCQGPDEEGTKCCYCWSRQRAEAISSLLLNHHIPTGLTSKLLEHVLRRINPPRQFKKRNEYMKKLLPDVSVVISPSRSLMTLLSEHSLSAKRWIYSEHGYDLTRFTGFQKRNRGTEFVFAYLGGIAKHKGIDLLIEAFSSLHDKRAELVIYGSCDWDHRRLHELQAKVWTEKAKIRGTTTDIASAYSAADVVVVPSVCHEAASLVLREALITRTPVIASNIGGLAEFVREKRSGLLFEAGNWKDLSEKMRLIMNDPGTLHKLRSGMRERVKSVEEQAQELEEIYREVIRGKWPWCSRGAAP